MHLATALTVIAVAVVAVMMVGAGADVIAILVSSALVLTFMMLHQDGNTVSAPEL